MRLQAPSLRARLSKSDARRPRTRPVGYGLLIMAFPERRTVDILLTTALLTAVGVAVYCARRVILMFVFAILFTYLIDPVVKFLQRHSLCFRNLRGPAVVEVYLTFVLLIALAGYTFAPSLATSTARVLDEAPAFLNSLSTGDIASDLRGKYGWSEAQELRFRAFLARHKQDIQSLVPTVDRYLSNTAQIFGCFLLIPILAIFFLRDGHRIRGCSHSAALSYRSASEDSCISRPTAPDADPIH